MTTPDERRGWPRVAIIVWRFLFPAIAIASLVLGFRGLSEHLGAQDEFADDLWDRLYYTLQLFVLGAPPLDDGGAFPPSLQIARFLAPAVTVYAVIETVRLLFASELVRLRARRSRGHVIVCGESLVGDALTARLSEGDRRVVRVVPSDEPATARGRLLFVSEDSGRPDLLRGAGVDRAATLYVCSGNTARDIAVVLAVTTMRRRRRGSLRVHVQVDDPELCLALQARRLGQRSDDRLNVNFFNWHELAAHALLAERRPPAHPDRATQVMIVGASWFGRALIVELARLWRLQIGRRRLEVAVVDSTATELVERLLRLYPFINAACAFTCHDQMVATLLDGDLPGAPPDRVYICCDDEEVGLKLALTMDHFWRGGPRSVIVRVGQLGGLTQAFYGPGERLLDPISGALHLFDALRAGTDISLTEDSLTERLARSIHDRYLRQQLIRGVPLDSTPAMRPWPDLSDEVRAANRAQAADIGPKLHVIGCAIAPNPVWGEPEVLSSPTIERLAEWEHNRWCDFQRRHGWTYAPRRNDRRHQHPDLIGWAKLDEATREKDREAVRQLPELLSDAGFRIVRVDRIPRPRRPGDERDLTTLRE